jgi:hypothetical protein
MDNQYVPPTQYSNINSTPLIHNSVPAVAKNQISPSQDEVTNLKTALRSNTQFVTCPFCRNQAMTRTERTCSVANIICCIFTTPLTWLIFQACRSKDISCYDADHFCTRCGNNLANYHAC